MSLLVPLLVVGLAGIGTGFGVSSMLGKPKTESAAGQPPADPTAVAAAAAEQKPADSKEKSAEAHGTGDDKKTADTDAAHAAGLLSDQQKAMVVSMKDTEFVPLTPVIANLASPSSSWIRLEGSLAVKKSPDHGKPDAVVNLVAPKILDYLKTLSLDQVQGADNLAFLNMDLNEIVRASSDGQVQAILVTGFVVE